MALSASELKDRFEGCLLGLAVGDALGAKFEAQTADAIHTRFASADSLLAYPQEEIWYTDDTQMAIGVAETLVERGEIVEEVLCRAFVSNYVPSRGYGRGARAILDAMEDGRDYPFSGVAWGEVPPDWLAEFVADGECEVGRSAFEGMALYWVRRPADSRRTTGSA